MKIYVFYSPTELYQYIKIVDKNDVVIKEYIRSVDDIEDTITELQKEYVIEEVIGW